MKLITGLNPMEHLFKKVDERQRLIRLVRETAGRLRINDWIGAKESLEFENLWQLKAAAADTNGKTVPPVLCRALGAFRHSVNGLPVWGAASVAIRVAGAGQLDCLQIQLRESTGEVVEQAKVLRPDHAAGQILLQMNRLFGNSRIPAAELAVPGWMRFGYLSLPKRKAQRVLAPFYVASIQTKSPQETQSYLFATPATETAHLPLCLNGSEARPGPARNVHATCT